MVLWEYWPRWIVALPGQHRGKVEVMLVNFMPLLVTSLFKFGMAFSEPGIWSSVRTKMMLGRSKLGDINVAESMTVASTSELARSTAVATETSSRAVLFVRLPLTWVRQIGKPSMATIRSPAYRNRQSGPTMPPRWSARSKLLEMLSQRRSGRPPSTKPDTLARPGC
jgi:hypothetical protein